MADSSRVRVSIVAESTFGTTPTTPTFLVLPITGTSMKDRVGYVQSNIINSSRDVEDLVRLSRAAGGGIPCELRYSPSGGGLDVAIAAMMCNTFTAATTQVTSVTSTSGVLSGGSGNVETGIEEGDIVRILDNSDVLIGYARVASINAGTHTVTLATGHGIADGSNRKVKRGARIKNGTLTPSHTVEVAYLDLQVAQIFRGIVFAQADWNVAIGSLASLVFSMDGKNSTWTDAVSTDTFITGATYTAVASHPSLDPIGVTEIQVGGVDYAASSVAVSWSNNVRAREQLGALGPTSMARGQFGVSGQVSAYFEDYVDHQNFAGNVATDMWFAMLDANSRGYSISYPQSKFSDVANPVSGNNADIFQQVSVTAYKDPTELCTVRLQRWD